MRSSILSLSFFLISISVLAQSRNSIWCFGDSSGIDFSNTINPVPISTIMDGRGSCVSISDSLGTLLFYAFTRATIIGNTTQVLSVNDSLMTNGGNIVGVNLQDGQNADISGNTFTGERGVDKFAIYRESPGGTAVLRVSGNTFTNQMYSTLFKLVDGDSIEIANNSVNMDSIAVPHYYQDVVDSGQYGKSGFYIAGNVPSTVSGSIHDNEISNVNNKIAGINLTGITISDNKIYETIPSNQLSSNIQQSGIYLQNMVSIVVSGNYVLWDKYTPDTSQIDWMKGIFLKSVTSSDVRENHLINLPSGVVFFDSCLNTYLRCNTFDTCAMGVWLDPNGVNRVSNQGYYTGTYSADTSWKNHWISTIGSKVDGTALNQFHWLYVTSGGSDYDPGINALYLRDSCAFSDSACSPPARFGMPGEDSTETDSVSYEIIQQLDSLANQNTIESNLQYVTLVNENYFKEGITPDSAVIIHLATIADMHPYYGGKAVYFARAMLHRDVNDVLQWMRKAKPRQENIQNLDNSFRIYPNPATEKTTIKSKKQFKANTFLLVNNLLGVTVQIISLPENQTSFEFSVASLQSGVYHCILLSNGVHEGNFKMVIVK